MAALFLLAHTACHSYVPLQPALSGTSASAASPAAQLGLEGLEQGVSLRIYLSEPGSYPLRLSRRTTSR